METLDTIVARRKSTGMKELTDSEKSSGLMPSCTSAGHIHHHQQHHHHHQNHHHHHHHHHHPAAVGTIPVRGRIYRSFPIPSDNAAAAAAAGVGIANIAVVSPPVVAAVATATATPAGENTNTPATSSAVAPRWVTREIAALDFLLGIPLENEASIIHAGLNARLQVEKQEREINKIGAQGHHHHHHQQRQHHGKHSTFGESTATAEETLASSKDAISLHWWEKLISNSTTADRARIMRERLELEEKELEKPNSISVEDNQTFATTEMNIVDALERETAKVDYRSPTRVKTMEHHSAANHKIKLPALETYLVAQHVAPGRRLDGREASFLKPPKIVCTMDKLHHGRSIAATSELREWEVRLAHGIGPDKKDTKGLLDGRTFFSSQQGYPFAVFSLVRYEPKKEEAARRRRKVEELGGGGMQFVIPVRDWRGVSYASLMKKRPKQKPPEKSSDQSSDSLSDGETGSLSTSDESDTYEPGFLDDPAMVQGRHRQVMVGNKVIGPIISSVIQFVDPADLKADLNKQFFARFDGWEPPKCQRRYIGGHVVNGVYTLVDPTEIDNSESSHQYGADEHDHTEKRSSFNSDIDTIRMPPSLTLSKIRSLKQQILVIGLKSDLEISTIALASVYFERLCLDCRVDKSNRQLTFAACLLLAYKTNEPNVAIIHTKTKETKKGMQQILHPFIQPARKSIGVYSALLDHLTNHFSLSLKNLLAAEWGVFVALGFKLHAKPSQVAFHFKRIMKVLERNALNYLGEEMYNSWQECLVEESRRKELREERQRARLEKRERKLIKLQRQLQIRQKQEAVARRRSSGGTGMSSSADTVMSSSARESYDEKGRGDEQGTVNRRIPSLGNNNSNHEDTSSILPATQSSTSGEPSPKRTSGERSSNKIKAWANVLRGAAAIRPSVTGKETDGSVVVGSPSPMRKSVSLPHFNQDNSLLSPENRVSVPHSRPSLLNRKKNSFSESIPIDILVEDDENETMEKIHDDSEIV